MKYIEMERTEIRTGYLLLLLICLLTISCSCRNLLKDNGMVDASETSISTEINASVSDPFPYTISTHIVVETPAYTITPTAATNPEVIHEIIRIEAADQYGFDLKGRIILLGGLTVYPFQSHAFLFDLEENKKWLFANGENQFVESYAISPDRTLVAFLIGDRTDYRRFLQIVNYEGDIVIHQDISHEAWFDLINWYNNESVVFSKVRSEGNLYYPDAVVIYNPFTQQINNEFLLENFPEADSAIPPRIGWKEFTTTLAVYSPDFNFVAYYTGGNAIILYDIRQKEVLLTLYPEWDFVPIWGYGPPRWASNSENFFIDMNTNYDLFAKGIWSEEIFRVSINGEQERLTCLADQYHEVTIESLMVSPDDKKIAFWINTDTSNPNLTLAILEIATKRIKILDGITFNVADTFMPPSPVWAPDSNQLMVNIRDEEIRFTTILVDLEENFATELAWDTKPIGWLCDDTP